MATAADLKFVLSGGAANTDQMLALGGAISTAAGGVILSQSFTASTLGGITINDAAGNGVGAGGLMTYTTSGTTLQWTSPGGSIGAPVNIGVTGDYAIYDSTNTGHIKISVVSGSLGGDATQNITIANYTNKLFDDISQAESAAGDIDYRCFYVKNAHAADTMAGVLLWIDQDPVGVDSIAIGLDPVGTSGTATTIADVHTAPTGVTFTAPTNETTALNIGTLTTGQYYAVWMQRSVSVTTSATALDYSRLKLRFI